MYKRTDVQIAFRAPRVLVEALDAVVNAHFPEVKSRTHLILLALYDYLRRNHPGLLEQVAGDDD